MKICLSWLRDFVPYEGTVGELSDILTHLGLSVESVERVGIPYTSVVIGKVISAEKVAGSDHLKFCQVEVGVGELLPIICGAPNVAAGQTVPVALVGARLPGNFVITERKLRGVISRGMICSQRELGLSEDHAGIMVLPEDWQIGKPVEEYLGGGDVVLDLEVTFNRPDCLSHLGVAREVAAKTGLPLKMPDATPVESDEETNSLVSVEILDPDRCPRYTARVVRGVTIVPSPQWMQDRLKAVGVRPISNVVDATNYVMMELGHPLHAFDYHLVKQSRIIVRPAADGEKFRTLDDKEHVLSSSDLLIADPERGIALAGIMGGANSEIVETTRDVLIECAYFEPVGIRLTSRDRAIASESSRRFERGVDPEMTVYAANRAAFLIQQLAGGEVLKGAVDAYPNPWHPKSITLRPSRVNAILATDLNEPQMSAYLSSLACDVRSHPASSGAVSFDGDGDPTDIAAIAAIAGASDVLTVTPPSWRGDLEREIDLIEEIIRLHGYNEVGMATRSAVPLEVVPERELERRLTGRIKQALVELGFREAITWSLISPNDAGSYPNGLEPVRVINPLSEDLSILRSSLAPTLMRAVERNLNVGIADVRLFEWGMCFWMDGGQIKESLRLGVIIIGNVRPESWIEKGRVFESHDLGGLVMDISQRLKLDSPNIKHQQTMDILRTGGFLLCGGSEEPVGQFGQLVPEVASRFGIERPAWYIEIKGDQLLAMVGRVPSYRPLPKFPPARRDLAFLVENSVKAGELEELMKSSGGDLLEQVHLFDCYTGSGIPVGWKSLAFHLTFRSPDRTLADQEVDEAISEILRAAKATGAELRAV